jgi:hypothetical protein
MSSTGTDSSSETDSSGNVSTDQSSGTTTDDTNSSDDGEPVSRETTGSGELPADDADSGAIDPRIHDPGGRFLLTSADLLENAFPTPTMAAAALPSLSLRLRG